MNFENRKFYERRVVPTNELIIKQEKTNTSK
jgi:hypothetical protein